ncbi:hypothetical protein E2562_018996 [Oryza meyeriana var. granulata]|uniref:Uncharacterized protein n=1 Tax=Oryza meyeriana var. granulata TaxID=110450 RepID=A0A6G1DJG2_9ORYZ|nr:hypothetical protein E2562_018996 [Oryza meyeriana var. granulata]
MEDEDEVRGMLPPVAASLESRSKRKMVPPSIGNRGGRGHGRGSAAAKSTTPSASISVETDTHIEPLAEDEDGEENFDMNDATAISVSVPSDDDESQEEEDGDDVSVPSNPLNAARGLKAGAGIHLSPSKTKVKRGKRAGCWKYFKEISVQSKKEFGVMGEDGDDDDIESVELPSSVVESN